jgi:hypothetical protein
LAAVARVSAAQPDQDLIVIALEKEWEPDLRGIRTRNPYYSGRVSEVRALWYRGGQVQENRVYAGGV